MTFMATMSNYIPYDNMSVIIRPIINLWHNLN